jgi:hypothetical protein
LPQYFSLHKTSFNQFSCFSHFGYHQNQPTISNVGGQIQDFGGVKV